MERKIGEIFEYNDEWYQCVPETYVCDGCVFKYNECKEIKRIRGKCQRASRKDDGVIFKKLEKVGDPITVNGKNVQLLKTTIANCDNCAFYKDANCDFTCYPRRCYGGEEGTYVEIKTKEDMEENKLKLKPFDIQKAREGKPVCTRDGQRARIICFDRKLYHDGYNYPIVAMVNDNDNDNELVHAYTQDGLLVGNMEGELDLMMLPEKKEGWVNVYKERIYSTKEEAIEATYDGVTYVDTVKVCWEE